MAKHGVSRGTVREALRGLHEAGLVRRTTKIGTVVQSPPQPAVSARRIIGVVFPQTHDAFCLDIMKGVQTACRERGYHAAFGYSHFSSAVERAEVSRMRSAGFGGVLVLPHDDPTLFRELVANTYPFVYIDQKFEAAPSDFVGVDNVSASFTVTEHLIGLGHRHIGFIHRNPSLDQAPSTVKERYRGYRAALTAHAVPFESSWLVEIARNADPKAFLALTSQVDAVVAANDHTALKFLDVATKAGVRVPEEIALVGFDDLPLAAEFALTTVAQPSREIGLRAAHLLIDRIEGKGGPPQHVILPTHLVVRATCGQNLRASTKGR
nr:substrate-binding domain-containing protein [Truepera radiovictrix]